MSSKRYWHSWQMRFWGFTVLEFPVNCCPFLADSATVTQPAHFRAELVSRLEVFFLGVPVRTNNQHRSRRNARIYTAPHTLRKYPLCQLLYLLKNRLRSLSIAWRMIFNAGRPFARAISLISRHCSGVKILRSSFAASRSAYSSIARRTISDLSKPVFSLCSFIHSILILGNGEGGSVRVLTCGVCSP